MAKRSKRENLNPASAAVGARALEIQSASQNATLNHTGSLANFLVFELLGRKFGFQLGNVAEIIRVPNFARMPLSPRSLLGLANNNGVVLPVIDLRRLLGLPDAALDASARVIVIARASPIGYIVDRIDGLVSLPAEQLEKSDAGAGSTRLLWTVSSRALKAIVLSRFLIPAGYCETSLTSLAF